MRSLVLLGAILCITSASLLDKKKHHKHHHKHHNKVAANVTGVAAKVASAETPKAEAGSEEQILGKMKKLETELAKKEEAVKGVVTKGRIEVNGPLPADFAERFTQGVAKATGCDPSEVKVIETNPLSLLQTHTGDVVEVVFEAPADVVKAVEDQAADPDSKLASGSLKEFLVAKDSVADATPVQEKGIDVDTEMPYGELEPFGREDTAQELTESSIKESDEMVDQLERAEVAEEKRAVFRALTRLRGAAITSFDGVARSQTGNIDEYNKTHKWRKTHPLHHLADEESDISKWAFPDNADF
eukprot:gnl/MRDRNA2_/MRDRNA2_87133_c0_seq1.p1 gnl/MRDRNA2_/MRDRNA2_87133_c0~~gnl/MRDRNA2_/MRDRNA2_87133_c0_seq1.p1  ORF type:complete len:301 (-),score=86.69 gnl/MRDRNA2_/MRDRNA2_87133_c0_seq1:20-922(-)